MKRYIGKTCQQKQDKYSLDKPSRIIFVDKPEYSEGVLIWYDIKTNEYYQVKKINMYESRDEKFDQNLVIKLDNDYLVDKMELE